MSLVRSFSARFSRDRLPVTLAAASLWTGASQAQTITTSPITTLPMAATPVPFGQPLTWWLLTLALCAGAMWLLKRMNVSMGTLRQIALGGCALALVGTVFWGNAVLAQLQWVERQFTQPGGETLGIPVQPVETEGVITGFVPVEFTNATALPMRIKDITMPTWSVCFPAGIPSSPATSVATPSSMPCAVGRELAAGQACWVDTAALCMATAAELQGAFPSELAADAATINEGTTATGNVLTNDADADGPLLVASYVFGGARYPAGQSATIASLGEMSLQANGDYQFHAATPFPAASTAITYATHTGAVAVLTIQVNRAPVAMNDAMPTDESTAVSIAVLGNDTDPDNDALHIANHTQGQSGSVVMNGTDQLIYTPNAGYTGNDSFDYTVSDGTLSATAKVTVTVHPVVGVPVCGNGILDAGEQCDDGNTSPGDGCSAACTVETSALRLPAAASASLFARPIPRPRIQLLPQP